MNPAEFQNIAAAEERLWWYRGMRGILFQELDGASHGRSIQRALDAGCGTGSMAEEVARRYGWRTIGLEANAAAMPWLRRRAVEGVQGDIIRMPFPDGCCDVLLSLDVLIHLTPGTEEQALREFVRVVRPGGLLVMRVAAFDWLRSRHSIFIEEKQRFTRARLLRQTVDAGWRPLRCTYLNLLALPLAAFKFRVWEPLFDRTPRSGVGALPGWLDAGLLGALRLEKAWLSRGYTLPLGQSLLLVAERPR
ncbi:class I SAM-dependent methyltransferase [Paludibaculum fermentans]|uniref:class I SAM-dependent methyltransferase n=1 Tax=Paludibaculum fermentans TaxID=1473598 RepID=UPI003EB97D03